MDTFVQILVKAKQKVSPLVGLRWECQDSGVEMWGVPVCSSVTYLGLCSSWNSTKAMVFGPSFLMLHEGNELGDAGCIYMN